LIVNLTSFVVIPGLLVKSLEIELLVQPLPESLHCTPIETFLLVQEEFSPDQLPQLGLFVSILIFTVLHVLVFPALSFTIPGDTSSPFVSLYLVLDTFP